MRVGAAFPAEGHCLRVPPAAARLGSTIHVRPLALGSRQRRPERRSLKRSIIGRMSFDDSERATPGAAICQRDFGRSLMSV